MANIVVGIGRGVWGTCTSTVHPDMERHAGTNCLGTKGRVKGLFNNTGIGFSSSYSLQGVKIQTPTTDIVLIYTKGKTKLKMPKLFSSYFAQGG